MKVKFITFIISIVCLFCGNVAIGQLSGVTYDQNGAPISFVTVYEKGTTNGTVSNIDGGYTLNLERGKHTIIFKYIGYTEVSKEINIDGILNLDIALKEQSVKLDDVVISANAEDPAYRVIRAAIRSRDKHNNEVKKYAVDLYVKGVVRMLETPKKIFGKEIGDMNGMLDSTGRGIVYLAESQSHVYFHQPNFLKEEMYSSIVAEDDGSYNFNQFKGSNFNIYEEYFEFGRSMLNPLADNALLFYNYKLVGTHLDEQGRIINKIKVIPKSNARPTVFGTLYIIEDSWRVKELKLSFTGKAIKQPVFDTITIQQIHLPVDNNAYRVFSQTMRFTLGGFGFKVGGGFTYVFSNYDVNPDFDKSLFSLEDFKMNDDAVKIDSSFWTSVRPVQLTQEEKNNYVKKDSLKKLWASKSYMDSLDREDNKFSLANLLFGYTYSDSYNKRSLSISSPLSTYNFNPVSGHIINAAIEYEEVDSFENRRLRINSKFEYGFSDRRIKNKTKVTYRTNRKFWENWIFELGDSNVQFDSDGGVPNIIDTWTNLLYKKNLASYYRKKHIGFGYEREVYNGLFVRSNINYIDRSPLYNTSDFSFRNREDNYRINNDISEDLPNVFFKSSSSLEYNFNARIRIGQTYSSYPKFRVRSQGNWPDIWLYYTKGISTLGDTDYDKLKIRIYKYDINYKIYGHSRINIEGGTFLNKEKLDFMDQFHFTGAQTLFTFKDRYIRGFKTMPFYKYTTTNNYISGFYEHNLDGFLLDLIPEVNKLGWKTVIGANALVRQNQSNYYECSFGISEVKIKSIVLFRFDYVWSFDDTGLVDRGIVLGLSSLFN